MLTSINYGHVTQLVIDYITLSINCQEILLNNLITNEAPSRQIEVAKLLILYLKTCHIVIYKLLNLSHFNL